MTELSRAERFLTEYASLEDHLRRTLNRDQGYPYKRLVEDMRKKGLVTDSQVQALYTFGYLRNALAHAVESGGEVIADPRQSAVDEFIALAEMVKAPPFLVEAMWNLLRQGDPTEAVRTTDAAERLKSLSSHFRGLADATIPYWRVGSMATYLTFAGIELNTALANWLGGQAEATEIAVHTGEDLVPESLPAKVSNLKNFLPPPGDDSLTNFQLLLPLELLRRESDAAWATSPVYQRTFDRLRRSTVVEITQPVGLAW